MKYAKLKRQEENCKLLKIFLSDSNVRLAKSFKTAAKPLLKKYPSLSKDLHTLETELINILNLERHWEIIFIRSDLNFQ